MEPERSPEAVFRHVVRQYERARLLQSSVNLAVTVPLTVATHRACGQSAANVVAGLLLSVTCVALLWRGRHFGAAVRPGLVAGLVPLLLPLLFRSGRSALLDFCWSTTVPLSIAGGFAAGIVVALQAARMAQHRLAFVLSGVAVAAMAGSLGCLAGGVASLMGLTAGVVGGALPILAYAHVRDARSFR
jgi:hypothetical protein